MIAKLTGTLELLTDSVIIDVQGVGYKVWVSNSTLLSLQEKKEVTLYTYTHVREESLELYGFASLEDQRLFELLLSVNGIGPRTALAISQHGAKAIAAAVQEADVAFFTQVPRVGKKQAQKIIIELKSKLGSMQELELGSLPPEKIDVQEALIALGYDEQHTLRLMKQLPEGLSTQEAITWALQQVNKS